MSFSKSKIDLSESVPKLTENNWRVFRRKMAIALHSMGLGEYLSLHKYIPINPDEETELKNAMSAKDYSKHMIIAKRNAYALLLTKIDTHSDAESIISDVNADIRAAWDALCDEYDSKIVQDRRLLKSKFFSIKFKRGTTLAKLKSTIQQEAKLINSTYEGDTVGITDEDQLTALLAAVTGHPQFSATLTKLRLTRNVTFQDAYKGLRAAELQHNAEIKQRTNDHAANHGLHLADSQISQPLVQHSQHACPCIEHGCFKNSAFNLENIRNNLPNEHFLNEEYANVSQNRWYRAKTKYNPAELCRNYLAGRCFRGNACRFKHANLPPNSSDNSAYRNVPFCLRCQTRGSHHTRDCPESKTLNERIGAPTNNAHASIADRFAHVSAQQKHQSNFIKSKNHSGNSTSHQRPNILQNTRNIFPNGQNDHFRAHLASDDINNFLNDVTSDAENDVFDVQLPSDDIDFVDFVAVSYVLQLIKSQDNNLPKIITIIDSGATTSVFGFLSCFDPESLTDVNINIGGFQQGTSAVATKRGTAVIVPKNSKSKMFLQNSLFCESVRFNLLSESRLDAAGLKTVTSDGHKTVYDKSGKILLKAKAHKGLYIFLADLFDFQKDSSDKKEFPQKPKGNQPKSVPQTLTDSNPMEHGLLSRTCTGDTKLIDLMHRLLVTSIQDICEPFLAYLKKKNSAFALLV